MIQFCCGPMSSADGIEKQMNIMIQFMKLLNCGYYRHEVVAGSNNDCEFCTLPTDIWVYHFKSEVEIVMLALGTKLEKENYRVSWIRVDRILLWCLVPGSEFWALRLQKNIKIHDEISYDTSNVFHSDRSTRFPRKIKCSLFTWRTVLRLK